MTEQAQHDTPRIEALWREALEHIRRSASAGIHPSTRLAWIEARASRALMGLPYHHGDCFEPKNTRAEKILEIAALRQRIRAAREILEPHQHAFAAEALRALENVTPIPMVLFCPRCGAQHIDRDDMAKRRHRTHRCEKCAEEWRPCDVVTVGVERLASEIDEHESTNPG